MRGTRIAAGFLLPAIMWMGNSGTPLVTEARPAHDVTSVNLPNIVVTEGRGAVEIGIHRGEHGFRVARIAYSTHPLSAQVGSDFNERSGTLSLAAPSDDKVVSIPVIDDDVDEPVETFHFSLDGARGGTVLRYPASATITIIDDDGPARISFAGADLANYENRGAVRVTIVRSGDATDEASVNVAHEDGTALSGADYSPPATTTITWAAESRTRSIDVGLDNDSEAEDSETFSLTLAGLSGADLSEPQKTTVTILDDDSNSSDTTAPVSQYHLPRNGRTYKPGKLRSFHVITSDDASGVITLEGALRRKSRTGGCAWLTKTGFKPGSCSAKKWNELPVRGFVYWRLGAKLKSTTGAGRFKHYTAYARSTDDAGNVETKFVKGRNKITFEVE
jgi:Calx-beta domain